MHLVRGMTSLNQKRRRSQKKTRRQLVAEAEHEAYLKRLGVGKTSLPLDAKGRRLGINALPDLSTGTRTTSDQIPSNGGAKKINTYTGDELLGIATMHKSNAVPIRKDSKQSAQDISSMRR
jgi:hypothetical protein